MNRLQKTGQKIIDFKVFANIFKKSRITMPKKINPVLKAKIALEALQGDRTVSKITGQYNIYPNFVTRV